MPESNYAYMIMSLSFFWGVSIILSVVFFIITYNAKLRRQIVHVKMKDMENRFEEELTRIQIEIQQKTMEYISLEIHDNIGQMLSLAKMNLSTIAYHDSPSDQLKINDTKELVSRSISDLRNLSKTLTGEIVARTSLISGIELQLEAIERVGLIKTYIINELQAIFLDNNIQLILFRIVQESLNNIIKHAGATEIKIALFQVSNNLRISIRDNGVGIQLDDISEGNGLSNMKKRAKFIEAHLEINQMAERGTEVIIDIPNREPED